ncbi:MAG: hypothetical protein HZC54_00810 [Verrucomicrobia bacterium]|nr:hypothetical protein [Verrucomicrobiota bacterium]
MGVPQSKIQNPKTQKPFSVSLLLAASELNAIGHRLRASSAALKRIGQTGQALHHFYASASMEASVEMNRIVEQERLLTIIHSQVATAITEMPVIRRFPFSSPPPISPPARGCSERKRPQFPQRPQGRLARPGRAPPWLRLALPQCRARGIFEVTSGQ